MIMAYESRKKTGKHVHTKKGQLLNVVGGNLFRKVHVQVHTNIYSIGQSVGLQR